MVSLGTSSFRGTNSSTASVLVSPSMTVFLCRMASISAPDKKRRGTNLAALVSIMVVTNMSRAVGEGPLHIKATAP